MNSVRYHILKKLSSLLERLQGFSEREKEEKLRRSFAYCGEDVHWSKNFITNGNSHMYIGDHTLIGPNCVFYAAMADLKIGKYVMISPNVTMITGEHRTDVVGEYMRNLTNEQKLPENDQPITIEDDVWIGSNVTILKGTVIGRGSVIHAGAVVSGNVKPYTIYISNKLKVKRFNDEEIAEHEAMLREKYGSL